MANFIEISSKDNQLIKFVSQLQTSAKHRKENNLFVLEGLRICDDAYQNNIRFDKLIVTKSAIEKHGEAIELFASVSNSCYILREDLFKNNSDKSHRHTRNRPRPSGRSDRYQENTRDGY